MLVSDISDHPTTRVVTLTGHVDALHTLKLEEIIEEAKEGRCHHVIFNFSRVISMDLGGLGNLFMWYHTLQSKQIVLSIVAPPLMVRHMLESVHLTELIPIYTSIPEAISHYPVSTSISSS